MYEASSTDIEITDEEFRTAATKLWCDENLQIDDDAEVSESDAGAWVRAWVWVKNEDARTKTSDVAQS